MSIAQFRGMGRGHNEMEKPGLRDGEKIRKLEGRKKKKVNSNVQISGVP